MSFKGKIDSYRVDAFEYEETLLDFIDKEYDTKYNDCEMNDEIERLSDEIKHDDDFGIVEQIYDIACDEYPAIKQYHYLNPYLRHYNVFRIFDDLFSINIVETLSHLYEDDEFDNKINDVKHKLTTLAPSCEQIIDLLLRNEENDEHDYMTWWKPKNEFMNGDYERLFNAVNDVRPNVLCKGTRYFHDVYFFTKDAFTYEREIMNYVHEHFKASIATLEKMRDKVVNNQIGLTAIEEFYDLLREISPELEDEASINPHLKLVNSYRVFNGVINKYITKPLVDKFKPNEQDEQLQRLKKELLILFPECEKIIVPFMEHSNKSMYDPCWQIQQSIMLSKPYIDLYNYIIHINMNMLIN